MLLNLDKVYKGDSFKAVLSALSAYSDHDYKLLLKGTEFSEAITGTIDGSEVSFFLTSEITEAMPVGTLNYQLYVENTEEKRTIETGQFTVVDTTTPDYQTDYQKRLQAIQAAIDAFILNGAIKNYTIDGKTVTREDLPELIRERNSLAKLVATEKSSGNSAFRPIYVRFRT
jgi:chorismate mutase